MMVAFIKKYILWIIFFSIILSLAYSEYVDKRSDIEKCADTKYAFDHSTQFNQMMLKKDYTIGEAAIMQLGGLKRTSIKEKSGMSRYLYWFEICEKEKLLAPKTFNKQWSGSFWL